MGCNQGHSVRQSHVVNKSVRIKYLQGPALPPAECPRKAKLGLPFPGAVSQGYPGRKGAKDSISKGRRQVISLPPAATGPDPAPLALQCLLILLLDRVGLLGPKPLPDGATRQDVNSGEKFRVSHLPLFQEVKRLEDRTPSRAYAGHSGEVVLGTGCLVGKDPSSK